MKKYLIALMVIVGCSSAFADSRFYGVTTNNELVSFDSSAPSTFVSTAAIVGLLASDGVTSDPGATVENLAYNPVTGLFVGVDSNANIYSIAFNGVATLVSSAFSPTGFSAGLSYDSFTGAMVFVSEDAENFLIDGSTITPRANLAYGLGDVNEGAAPAIFGLAIDPDFGSAFFVDYETDTLSQAFDPDLAELFTLGGLGFDVTGFGDLAIDFDGALFAAFSTDGLTNQLYSIDDSTGAATLIGSFGTSLTTFTAIPVPEPGTPLLACLTLLTVASAFRRRASRLS